MSRSVDLPSLPEIGLLWLLISTAAVLCGVSAAGSLLMVLAMIWITGSGIVARFFPEARKSAFRFPLASILGWSVLSFILILVKACFDLPEKGLILILLAPLAGLICYASSPSETGRDEKTSGSLAAAFVVTAILFIALVPVFSHVGFETASGAAYRAYFNGDFLKHIALIHEFSKSGVPPRNPYFSDIALHYYWFIYPAVWLLWVLGDSGNGPQPAFILFTLSTGALFVTVLIAWTSDWAVRIKRAIPALFFITFAMSYEGVLLWMHIHADGKPFWREIGHYNIDGYTRWLWGHPQIDGLYRSFLYTPQHLMALAVVLVGMGLSARFSSKKYHVLEAILTGLSTGISIFVGGIACVALVMRRLTGARRHLLLMTVPVLGLWSLVYIGLKIVVPAGNGIQIERHLNIVHIILILFVNFGVIGLVGLWGLILAWKDERPGISGLGWLLVIAGVVFLFVRLKNDPSDIGLKSALVVISIVAVGCVYAFRYVSIKRLALLSFLMAPALLTAVSDLWSTWNIETPRYISFVPDRDRKACSFLAENTAESDIIQALPDRSPRGYYSLIPTFAGRRTALGDPMHGRIFQVPEAMYRKRLAHIRALFKAVSSFETIRLARSMRIDSLLIGPPERRRYRNTGKKWILLPEVYRSGGISVYRTVPALVMKRFENECLLVSRETLFFRRMILKEGRKSDEKILENGRVVELPPSAAVRAPFADGNGVYVLPRQEDYDIPRVWNIINDHRRWGDVGGVIGWSDAEAGTVLQVDEGDPGTVWRRPFCLLPPGQYVFKLTYFVFDVADIPPVFGIEFKSGHDRVQVKLTETPPQDSGDFSVLDVPVTLSSWSMCDLFVRYGGRGVFTLDSVECRWTAPEDWWLELKPYKSPANT